MSRQETSAFSKSGHCVRTVVAESTSEEDKKIEKQVAHLNSTLKINYDTQTLAHAFIKVKQDLKDRKG